MSVGTVFAVVRPNYTLVLDELTKVFFEFFVCVCNREVSGKLNTVILPRRDSRLFKQQCSQSMEQDQIKKSVPDGGIQRDTLEIPRST